MPHGVNIFSTINTGLFPHALGFLFLVAWIRYFFDDDSNSKKKLSSVIWFSLILLTDVHLVLPAFIFFVVRCSFDIYKTLTHQEYRHCWQTIFEYILYGLLSLGLASFWLLPMSTHYDYFSSTALPISTWEWFQIVNSCFYLPPLIAGGLYLGFIHKQKPILLLSVGILALYALTIIGSAFYFLGGSLPFHFQRYFASILYISPIIFAYVLTQLVSNKKYQWWAIFLFTMLILISIYQVKVPNNKTTQGIYLSSHSEHFDEIIQYMQKIPQGLVLVEADSRDRTPRQFAMDAKLGEDSVRTVFSIFREASMSSLYLLPVRNAFSSNAESMGITSFLNGTNIFVNNPDWKGKLNIAHDYFGVRYIIASTPKIIQALNNSGYVHLLKNFGPFVVFEIASSTPIINEAIELHHAPIALFAPIGLHHRQRNDLSFSRFSEEWLRNFDPDIIFVHPQTLSIENNPIFDIAGSVVLASYKYQNLNHAIDEIEKFTLNGTLILFDRNDEFSSALKQKHIRNIIYLPLPDNDHTLKSIYPSIQRILKNNLIPLLSKQHLLLIRQSYFPEWKALDGSTLYLASPSFILAVSNHPQIKLIFTTPLSVYMGYALSLLSLILIIFLTIYHHRNQQSLPSKNSSSFKTKYSKTELDRYILILACFISLVSITATCVFITNYNDGESIIYDFNQLENLPPSDWWSQSLKPTLIFDNDKTFYGIGKHWLRLTGFTSNWYVGVFGKWLAKDVTKYDAIKILILGTGPNSGHLTIRFNQIDNAYQTATDKRTSSPIYTDQLEYTTPIDWYGWQTLTIPFNKFYLVKHNTMLGLRDINRDNASKFFLDLAFVLIATQKNGSVDMGIDKIRLVKIKQS